MATKQTHSGSGDNVGGNKILNLNIPNLLIIGVVLALLVFAVISWQSNKERFFFNREKIDVALSVIDSLQLRELNDNEFQFKPEGIIYYEMQQKKDTLNIFPTGAYLEKLSNDQGVGEEIYLYTLIPKLNFKVTNNSNKTIFFSKIVLDVESSRRDPMPIPIFFTEACYPGFSSNAFRQFFNLPLETFDGPTDYSEHSILPMAIYNDGWSPMKNVNLSFTISAKKPNSSADYTDLPFSADIKEINTEAYVDIFPYLRKQGVDVDGIISATIDEANSFGFPNADLVRDGLGPYNKTEDGYTYPAQLFGYISYNDVEGKSYKHKFAVAINIYRSFGCGDAGAETSVYNISLCPTGKNYQITYPISNYIKTADIDNFSIQLSCPKSSIHKMGVKLYYSETEFVQRYINYHLIVPRRMVEEEVVRFKGYGKCSSSK